MTAVRSCTLLIGVALPILLKNPLKSDHCSQILYSFQWSSIICFLLTNLLTPWSCAFIGGVASPILLTLNSLTLQSGPVSSSVEERRLVKEEVSVAEIVEQHAAFHGSSAAAARFPGHILGYVTPVSIAIR